MGTLTAYDDTFSVDYAPETDGVPDKSAERLRAEVFDNRSFDTLERELQNAVISAAGASRAQIECNVTGKRYPKFMNSPEWWYERIGELSYELRQRVQTLGLNQQEASG